MNYQQFKKCVCDLSSRVATLEEGGGGAGAGVAEWNNSDEYEIGDVVWHENNLYVATADNGNSEPGVSGDWDLILAGDTGEAEFDYGMAIAINTGNFYA